MAEIEGLVVKAAHVIRTRASSAWNLVRRERRCVLCQTIFVHQHAAWNCPGLFCPACASALRRREKGYCPHCGELAAWPDLPNAPCLRCCQSPPPWEQFLFHAEHEGLLRRTLIRLKFHESPVLGHALGMLLASHPHISEMRADCIVPVPLHKQRLVRRGYNQSLELARPVSRTLGLPLNPQGLLRIRPTNPQTGASLKERHRNIRGAFKAGHKIRGKKVLLVDDTITTGATLRAAAQALLDGGAAAVSVMVASRTPRYYSSQHSGR